MIRAVLGGAFDPVHRGHVAMGAHLLDTGLADRLVVVPAGLSPLKGACGAGAADRLEMCRLAFAGLPRARVDDRELRRAGPSYTVDTLAELAAERPGDDLLFAMGADNVADFPRWRDPAGILKLALLVVFPRDGVTPTTAACAEAGIPADRVRLVRDFDHPVSSTAVRGMLRRGRVPDRDLPPAVAALIRSRHLYGV